MAELKLSDDGLYYWDGSRWISTLSPDGRWRWNGSAWVPLTGMVAPPYQSYQAYPQPAARREPTRWTKPIQYAVIAVSILYAAYTTSTPFWMAGTMSQAMNQAIQQHRRGLGIVGSKHLQPALLDLLGLDWDRGLAGGTLRLHAGGSHPLRALGDAAAGRHAHPAGSG